MSNSKPTREEAMALLREYQQNENLIKHALAVEAVMRHMAEKRGEDKDKWGVIGLIHDLDWEKYPDQHCQVTKQVLEERGWPDDYIHAVMSHGWGIVTDVEPEHEMEKVLYTIDELTGLITATALMRPSRSILDMKAKSVKKKWNQRSFAAGVDRDLIEKGAEMLGMELSEVIEDTLAGMQTVADDLDLRGEVQN
ncbi:MAG: HDIG domain-containing protein [Spirochaetes bacterium]|nr:HDIG domain-containing protein [Spirochaetota bacterium]